MPATDRARHPRLKRCAAGLLIASAVCVLLVLAVGWWLGVLAAAILVLALVLLVLGALVLFLSGPPSSG